MQGVVEILFLNTLTTVKSHNLKSAIKSKGVAKDGSATPKRNKFDSSQAIEPVIFKQQRTCRRGANWGCVQSAAPRPGEVRSAATPSSAHNGPLERRAFRRPGMVRVAVRTSVVVRRFDAERIVVRAEGAVDRGPPFPLETQARSIRTECARPGYVLDASG